MVIDKDLKWDSNTSYLVNKHCEVLVSCSGQKIKQALRSSCELLRTKDSKIFKKEHSGTFRDLQKPLETFSELSLNLRNLREPVNS